MWKQSVEREALLPSVKQALNEFFKGGIEEIRETDEENLSARTDPALESQELLSLARSAAQPYKVPSLRLPSSASSGKGDTLSQNDLMCSDSDPPAPAAFPDLFFSAPSLPALPSPAKAAPAPGYRGCAPKTRSQASQLEVSGERPAPDCAAGRGAQLNPRLRSFFDSFGSASPQRAARRPEARSVAALCRKEFAERAFRSGFRFEPGRAEKAAPAGPRSPKSAQWSFARDFNKENSCAVQPRPRGSPAPALTRFATSHSFKRNLQLR